MKLRACRGPLTGNLPEALNGVAFARGKGRLQMKFTMGVAGVGMIVAAFSVAGAPSQGAETAAQRAAGPSLVGAPALAPSADADYDLGQAAAGLGISYQELLTQVSLQRAMASVDVEALDPGYAEWGSTPGPQFRIWYRSADNPTEALRIALGDAGVLDYVDFEKVPLSFQDLTKRVESLQSQLTAAGLAVGVSADSASGGVILHSADSKVEAGTVSEANAILTADSVPFTWGDTLPQFMYIGGRLEDNTTIFLKCTGGFTVHPSGSTNRRLVLAGHCGSVGDNSTYAGHGGFLFKSSTNTVIRDIGTIDQSGVSWDPQVFFGAGDTRTVQAVEPFSSMHIGDVVAKYGQTTGYSVGTISEKHACSPLGCDPESLFVTVKSSDGSQMCDHGDSGGPWMFGDTAYGVTSFGNGGAKCSFSTFEGSGFVVVTQ